MTPATTSSSSPPQTQFPYFQYTSLLGTHTLLLAFTAIVLPRGTVLFASLPPQQSSLDRPQHRLLEPITASPVWTLLWLCAGAGACQAWWGGWMRMLWAAYPHHHAQESEGKTQVRIPARASPYLNWLRLCLLGLAECVDEYFLRFCTLPRYNYTIWCTHIQARLSPIDIRRN